MALDERRHAWNIGDVLDRVDLAALLDELTAPAQGSGPGRRWHCPMPNAKATSGGGAGRAITEAMRSISRSQQQADRKSKRSTGSQDVPA